MSLSTAPAGISRQSFQNWMYGEAIQPSWLVVVLAAVLRPDVELDGEMLEV